MGDILYNYLNSPEVEVPWQLYMWSVTMSKEHWNNLHEMVSLQNIEQGTPIHIPIYKTTYCFIMATSWKKHLSRCDIFREEAYTQLQKSKEKQLFFPVFCHCKLIKSFNGVKG